MPQGWRYEIVPVEVPSGVGHTPLSRAELMQGARNRAEELQRLARAKDDKWEYFVGLEGGLDLVVEKGRRWAFLESWAFVTDGERESFGRSGATPMPEELIREVVEKGVELSQAIDAYAGSHGIRDAQGAWGVLTGNLITRQDAFRVAIVSAFAPLFAACHR
jgi:inosine/xanthosine triphosphatase